VYRYFKDSVFPEGKIKKNARNTGTFHNRVDSAGFFGQKNGEEDVTVYKTKDDTFFPLYSLTDLALYALFIPIFQPLSPVGAKRSRTPDFVFLLIAKSATYNNNIISDWLNSFKYLANISS
jgi:hypothetical protein